MHSIQLEEQNCANSACGSSSGIWSWFQEWNVLLINWKIYPGPPLKWLGELGSLSLATLPRHGALFAPQIVSLFALGTFLHEMGSALLSSPSGTLGDSDRSSSQAFHLVQSYAVDIWPTPLLISARCNGPFRQINHQSDSSYSVIQQNMAPSRFLQGLWSRSRARGDAVMSELERYDCLRWPLIDGVQVYLNGFTAHLSNVEYNSSSEHRV
jgi:hypothetical protein